MKTTRNILPVVMVMAAISLTATSANAATLFFDDFEYPTVSPGPYGTFNGVPKTSQQRDTTKWVGATQGYGASSNGILYETYNPTPFPDDPDALQAYGFRYTNSGVTTAEGVIGILREGTYTVSFNVVQDLEVPGTSFRMELVAFNPGDNRTECRGGRPGTILGSVAGNAPSNGSWAPITLNLPVLAGNPSLGKDLGIRFIGATSSAVIDDVLLLGPGAGGIAVGATFGNWDLEWSNDPTEQLNLIKTATDLQPFDKEITVTGGLESITIDETVLNASGTEWTDYHFILGRGLGDQFAPLDGLNGLAFLAGSSNAFPGMVQVGPGELLFHGGILAAGDEAGFRLELAMPQGDPVTFTLRQIPSVPEPATMALLGLAACRLGGYVRRRKS